MFYSQNLQKQTPKIFQTRGHAPVLDPPLIIHKNFIPEL